MDLDLKILENKVLDKNVILEIKPFSLLHISDNSGNNFLPSTVNLSKNKILGLLENITEIHIPKELKKEILLKYYKSSEIKKLHTSEKEVFYLPLINDIIKINEVVRPKKYDFVYTQERRLLFSKGTKDKKLNINYINSPNSSYDINYLDKKINISSVKEDFLDEELYDKTPDFYTTMVKLTYLNTKDSFFINFNTNLDFYKILISSLNYNKSVFLGNSDSLVNLNII
jgi:hypothetical protein